MKSIMFYGLVLFFLCNMLSLNIFAAESDIAPDFTLKDTAGNSFTLSDYSRKNQPVLLFFWTTWCPYCLREIKTLDSKNEELQEKGIAIISINVGEERSRVQRLIDNYNVKFKVLLDESNAVADKFHIYGVPTFILVDKKGNIRFFKNYIPKQELLDEVLSE